MWCFFQAEDGIRDIGVTGVQTCALPICGSRSRLPHRALDRRLSPSAFAGASDGISCVPPRLHRRFGGIGGAACRARVELSVVGGSLKKKNKHASSTRSTSISYSELHEST